MFILIPANAFSQTINIQLPNNKALFQHVTGVADIPVSATASGVSAGGGVEFVLDLGTSSEKTAKDFAAPYSYTFKSLGLGEHTLDAYVIDSAGTRLAVKDHRDRVGVGDLIIALGDSITVGEEDDILSDNWSLDGRNGPYVYSDGTAYGGFEPILNNLLTAARGYPHSVINMGNAGDTAAIGFSKVSDIINEFPTARTWLVSYGTNDSNTGVSAGAFKSNLQSIINEIQSSIPGAKVYLPKVFYWTQPVIASYHDKMGDIARNTPNVYLGADLETLFKANHTLYDHTTGQTGTWFASVKTHHPNGIGVQKMAMLWKMAIVDRAILVTDGVLPSVGRTWADKIRLDGVDKIGLSSDNLLTVCEQPFAKAPAPTGASFVADWSYGLKLTKGTGFNGGTVTVTTREENDTLDMVGATSWSQIGLSLGSTLLPTTIVADPMSRYNQDLIAVINQPGQIATVANLAPSVNTYTDISGKPDATGWYSVPPKITLAGVDSTGAPVTTIRYKWDNGSETVYNGSFSAPLGTHTLYYYSIDQFGNVSSVESMVFKVADISTISIVEPNNKALFQHVSGVADILVSATASGVSAGGGVEFVLDLGTSSEKSAKDFAAPYSYTFKSIGLGEHTMDAYVIDSAGTRLAVRDHRDRVGVGDLIIALGDSITVGEEDDILSDNWSLDGRNGPYVYSDGTAYGGFEPILNNLLTAARGYPHSVINMGNAGDTAAIGFSKVSDIINEFPTARTWLVSYGTNDSNTGVSAGTFKSNLQSIINEIQSSIPGAKVYLPKVFYWTQPVIASYHDKMGDIARNTPNVYLGADLETLFKANHTLYDHTTGQTGTWFAPVKTHHPNGIGVQKMAMLWKMAIVDRAILVTDGVLPSVGRTWADKIRLDGVDKIGLSSDNLLTVCEQPFAKGPAPTGASFVADWSYGLKLTKGIGFNGGTVTVTTREENDTLDMVGATSWSQIGLSLGSTLLPTTIVADPMSRYNHDLIAVINQPGQIATVFKK